MVLANGSMSSGQSSGEGDIRRNAMVEGDVRGLHDRPAGAAFLLDPDSRPASGSLPRNKNPGNRWRDRRGRGAVHRRPQHGPYGGPGAARVLGRGHRSDRRHLSPLARQAETLEEKGWEAYTDTPGFCKSEGLETIAKFDHVLTPGRYVGAADAEDDGVSFSDKFAGLATQLTKQFDLSSDLQGQIVEGLKRIERHND